MLWASVNDVKSRWLDGDPPASDTALEQLIDDAEDAIAVAVPGIQHMIDSGTIPLPRAARVVARIVARYLRNPTGIRTLQETTGQFSGATTFAGDDLGEITVTDADRRELLGRGTGRGRAFTVALGRL